MLYSVAAVQCDIGANQKQVPKTAKTHENVEQEEPYKIYSGHVPATPDDPILQKADAMWRNGMGLIHRVCAFG